MKEMTDHELTNKISQVFNNFEDPSAEFGWQELRKKYPEKHRRPVLMWWGAVAAVLLMICGIWFLIPGSNIGDQKIADGKNQDKVNPGIYEKVPEKTSRGPVNNSHSPDAHTTDIPAGADPAKSLTASKEASSAPSSAKKVHQPSILTITGFAEDRAAEINPTSSQILSSAGNNSNPEPLIPLPQAEKLMLNSKEAIRDSVINARGRMLSIAQTAPAKDDHRHKVEDLPYASQKASSKNNTVSFYAGSYVNYALGSETKLNFGAGFTSDIKLGNNLRLSTGLALANNSLTFNNGVPSTGRDKLNFDLLPSFGVANNNLTTVTKYDASLLALDIPLNIKYLLIPKDNKLYMLAGLSSGTYLNEKYSLSYRDFSAAGFYVGQTQGSTIKNQFKGFDFARTLNISFGYSTNLGKTQNITIEPFLKYPLSGLGSEDLRFGSTGLNLKLNFSSFKK